METFQGGVTRLARVEFMLHHRCQLPFIWQMYYIIKRDHLTVPIHTIVDRFYKKVGTTF